MARWSSGLRLRPFTAATRVRISYGSPEKDNFRARVVFFILVAYNHLTETKYGGNNNECFSIGNSFSQDAQRYLHQIVKADGFNLNVFNLYIGGCPLLMHYRNMLSEQPAYTLEMNGESTGFNVWLKEGLLNRNWDAFTIQQVSHDAPYYDTYQPYLNKITEYVRLCVPKAICGRIRNKWRSCMLS